MTPIELSSNETIEKRLQEFSVLNKQGNNEWFSELCFCVLTANSRADKAIAIQQKLGVYGFLNKTEQELSFIIQSHAHRFHNNKAKYIVAARKYKNIKDLLHNLSDQDAREFLVKNIKGIGYKEASHFLRNVGYSNLAIIDRHILRFLYKEKLIEEIPKTITYKKYLAYEKILGIFGIQHDRLDLIIWEKMTGKVLK